MATYTWPLYSKGLETEEIISGQGHDVIRIEGQLLALLRIQNAGSRSSRRVFQRIVMID